MLAHAPVSARLYKKMCISIKLFYHEHGLKIQFVPEHSCFLQILVSLCNARNKCKSAPMEYLFVKQVESSMSKYYFVQPIEYSLRNWKLS